MRFALPDTYSTSSAARILGLSPRRVQQLAEEGLIEGTKSNGREWSLYQHSVHAYLEAHGPGKRGRGRYLKALDDASTPENAALADRLEGLYDRIANLQHELGRAQAARELTEKAESTLREQLDRERERADKAEDRAARLEAELQHAQKPWYRRLFGGSS